MKDFECSKDVDKYLWGFGFIVVTLIIMGVCIFYTFEKQRNHDLERVLKKENYGPIAPSPLPTPKGMNGPAESQVVGRRR